MPIRPWAVGLFVTLGLGLLAALLFMIGDRQDSFGRHVVFETAFFNLGGLIEGSKVRVSGIDAGRIAKIETPHSASEKFKLHLDVDEKYRAMVHKDSLVSIETEGVVGDKFVMIKRGTNQSPLAQPEDVLPSKEPFDLSAAMDRASALLDDIHGTVNELRGKVSGTLDTIDTTVNNADSLISDVRPDITKIARDASRLTGSLNQIASAINAGKGPAGLLLRDEDTRRQLQATIVNLHTTSESAEDIASRTDQVIADVQSRELVKTAQTSLLNIQAVTEQLNVTIKNALAEDSMGQDGATNLRETLSNINRSTANLAEDTEALKHNFFFRGFFKKRGFYSLDQISPDEYLKAVERNKNMGKRLWLRASTLVAPGSDGQETLTAEGRLQIDSVVAPYLNSLAGHLIVVEGYSFAGSPAQQSVTARRRADLVRRYLESRYRLRHSDVGIVALGTSMPANALQAEWEGGAIMLLESKP